MLIENPRPAGPREYLFVIEPDRPLAMLKTCPAYTPTPLTEMPALAQSTGVARLWVKDETQRMGLGSFKALGGAFAVAQMIAEAANSADLMSDEARQVAESMTFVTASAGNHGLSVAAGAQVFGARAVIVLSEGVPEGFANRIRATGADVLRVAGSYDDSVEHAKHEADRRNWLLLADGSWQGYVDRPALIMEGYTVLAEECRASFTQSGEWPTHILLQAGVGGLAAAVAAHVRRCWPVQPRLIVVEPEAAPCLLQSIERGELTRVEGPESNMGRLDCKDASLIAFQALAQDADAFTTVTDIEAAEAAKAFGQAGLKTTPSGGATLAALIAAPTGRQSRVLLIASEGLEGD